MQFKGMSLSDVYIIDIDPIEDIRGYFARTICIEELYSQGIEFNVEQCNISYNKSKGTLRGLHYQKHPYEEQKIVTCIKGRIYDVVIDLRRESSSFGKWAAVELCENTFRMLFVPKGCAHGFQTLEPNTYVYYQISENYNSNYSSGIRWDDPYFNVYWPIKNKIISKKDEQLPYYNDEVADRE